MTAVAFIALVIGLVLMFLGRLPTIVGVLLFVAGYGLAGIGWIQRGLAWVITELGRLGTAVLGVGAAVVATGLVVGLLILFVHDLHPKHTASRRTAWVGLLLGVLALAVGGSMGALLHGGGDALTQAFSTLFGGI